MKEDLYPSHKLVLF